MTIERIKQLRLEVGISQEQAAAYMGTSKRRYRAMEEGTARIRRGDMVELCDLYRVSADNLCGRSDRKEARPDVVFSHRERPKPCE